MLFDRIQNSHRDLISDLVLFYDLESVAVGRFIRSCQAEAILSSLSPITSERIRLTRVAGYIRRASFPPLIPDICFLMQFISSIGAPLASSTSVVCCISFKVSLTLSGPAEYSRGDARRAEPPPEIRLIMSVLSSACFDSSIISPAAFTLIYRICYNYGRTNEKVEERTIWQTDKKGAIDIGEIHW